MKRMIIWAAVLLLVCGMNAAALTRSAADFSWNSTRLWVRNGEFDIWAQEIEALAEGSDTLGTGSVFYVDSGVTTEGDGTSWSNAKDTLDEAINLCTANRGDRIYVAQGHTETMGAAADEVDVDVHGVTIIGVGKGVLRPRFDFTGAVTGAFAIGADNVTIMNLDFLANVTDVNEAIEVEAGSTDVTIAQCSFRADTEGTDEFLECIDSSGAASDRISVVGCFFGMGAGLCNSAIYLKDSDYAYIAGNISHGDYAVANINQVTTASNHITIENNLLFNGTIGGNGGLNAQPCIEVLSTTTGFIVNNQLACNVATPDLSIVAADMYPIGNTYSESEATSVPPMWLTTDTALNIIGFDDADNAYASTNVAANRDGTLIERHEYLMDLLVDDETTNYIGTNDADNAAVTSTVAANADGSILERQEFGQLQGMYYLSKTDVNLTGGTVDDVFTVTGGDIVVHYLAITLTEACSANACTLGWTWDPTAGAGTDTPIAAGVEANAAAIGDTFFAEGDATAAIKAAIATQVPQLGVNSGFVIGPGGIDCELQNSDLTSGVGTAKIIYRPLSMGATVAAP